MTPLNRSFVVLVALAFMVSGGIMLAPLASADSLNTADNFAVLAGSTITNAGAGVLGATVITGEMGVSPGTACTGFSSCPTTGPGTSGTVHLADSVALQAQNDLTTAYTTFGGLSGTLEPNDLTGLSLGPGVYNVGAASLAGTLTLNDGGVAGSDFIFLISSSLTTSPGADINVSGLSPSDELFWVVGSTATLGDNTAFDGNILALTSINFDPGATDICGRALAQNGAVTFAGQDSTSLIENQVSTTCSGTLAGSNGLAGGATTTGGGGGTTSVPEPSTLLLLALGLASLFGMARFSRPKLSRA
ncbi:MAG TPA: ice-binding family protein [Candidatus Dormibacteraeota bacterium]|nr:ice-binding family protein [Candidatus Dormibacteraeota bacterium]